MRGYFHGKAYPGKQTYSIGADLLGVIAADDVPSRLRPLAIDLGAGSALSSPDTLLQDLVNLHALSPQMRNVGGPATAALLGGSVSRDGELEAAGVAFGAGGGFLGFLTFVMPAALLLPGGSMYVAYRIYKFVRNRAALQRFVRVSRAAPHVATVVAMSDHELTRDEARLLRDLFRGRVGSPAERQALLLKELDPTANRDIAFDELRSMHLQPDDWPQLLSIAIATAHADHEYNGDEREMIASLRELTSYSEDDFAALAAKAETEYLARCHFSDAMVRACYQIACACEDTPPEDAAPLLDIVLTAALPSDAERFDLIEELSTTDGPTSVPLEDLTGDTGEEKARRRGLFRRWQRSRSPEARRVQEFGRTMALFLATLEQWRGWVVPICRDELFAIGRRYGLSERSLSRSLENAHRNIEALRADWLAPRPWQPTGDQSFDIEWSTEHGPEGAFAVRGLAAGRFMFHRGDTRWEWRSALTHFDDFCEQELDVDVGEVAVYTDDTTFELLTVTVESHASDRRVRRLGSE